MLEDSRFEAFAQNRIAESPPVFLVGNLSFQRQAEGENLLAHAAGDYSFGVNRSNLPLNFHRTSVVLA
jgi:hypothetical protein